jgi:arylsulfatase A-like enzyme
MKHLLLSLLLSSGLAMAEPLNVIVLFGDDWRADVLGAAGNSYVRTPNLDRLAAAGVRFTRAAVTTSICGVSRATLYTGQWMSRHGQRDFGRFQTPWADTYPGRMRAAGYQVGFVGKWHSGPFPAEGWDFSRAYQGEHWITGPGRKKRHVTQQNEADALEFLRTRDPAKPFCLTVAFFAAHAEDEHPLQYLPQPASLEWYNDAPVPVPANATPESTARLPEFLSAPANEGRNRWTWRFDTPGKYQAMMKNYFRLVTEVDAACGAILAEVERQGIADRTLVIFTTDNGYFHGEHGLADKWYPYEESIRVPLIVRDPRLPSARAGQVRDEQVLNVDLAPTILSAAGLPAPTGMQGADLAPLYRGTPAPAWREDFFYEHPTIRNKSFIPASEALVTREWKYIRWPEYDREQLFNLREDPREESDRIADPAAAEVLASLRLRFEQLKTAAR